MSLLFLGRHWIPLPCKPKSKFFSITCGAHHDTDGWMDFPNLALHPFLTLSALAIQNSVQHLRHTMLFTRPHHQAVPSFTNHVASPGMLPCSCSCPKPPSYTPLCSIWIIPFPISKSKSSLLPKGLYCQLPSW